MPWHSALRRGLAATSRPTLRPRPAGAPFAAEPLEDRRLLAGQTLAADINYGTAHSTTYAAVDAAGTLLLRTSEALWRSDGTTAGTTLVRDGLYMEQEGNFYRAPVAAAGRYAFFQARTEPAATAPVFLWASDGTPAGTRVVYEGDGKGVFHLSPAGNAVYFWGTGADGIAGTDLWKSDGTPAGTVRVYDFTSSTRVTPLAHHPSDGRVYFPAFDPATGMELWSSDGTEAGTRMVKDANPGAAGSAPEAIASSNGRIFFSATTAAAGREPWVSDGTAAGTVMVKDLVTGAASSTPSSFTPGPSGRTVFRTQNHLFATDGTAANTRQLDGTTSAFHSELTRSGNYVFFVVNSRLGATDGTPAGTRMLTNMTTGYPSTVLYLRDVGGQLYFYAGDGDGGTQLWKSNGTAAGTTRFWRHPKFGPGFRVMAVSGPAAARRLFFAFDDHVYGFELWSADGTQGGTRMVKDLNTRPLSSDPYHGAELNGDYFVTAAGPGSPRAWWVVDGAAPGPGAAPPRATGITQVPGLPHFPVFVKKFNGKLLYNTDNDGIFLTDGTPAGTAALQEVWPLYGTEFVEYRDRLYFITGRGGSSPFGVYGTDGTAAGSGPLVPGMLLEGVGGLAATGGYLYFAGETWRTPGQELWRSDGTAAGTTRLFTWPRNSVGYGIRHPFALGDRLFFIWDELIGNEYVSQLWSVADGSTTPTLVENLPFFIDFAMRPFVIGDKAYLSGAPSSTAAELLVTDGTAGGTRLVREINTREREGSRPTPLADLGGRLLFGAYDGERGAFSSLWATDGTEAGTRRLTPRGVDLQVGARPDDWTYPGSRTEASKFATVGGRFYFVADDGAHGREVWSTDGTPQGTYLHADVIPGPATSDPGALAAVGDALFFAATHPSVGREVWKLPGGAPAPTAAVSRHLFYNNSAFDGRSRSANAADDNAVAADKRPALPGDARDARNVSSYGRGINGVMIDVRSLPAGAPTAADFAFRAGVGADPQTWSAKALTPTIAVRRGAGVNGADRVTLTFPDGAVRNTWLEVTMHSNARTSLSSPDVFVFGNLVGEPGLGFSPPRVTAADVLLTRGARARGVGVTNAFDFNRDGAVNVLDDALARANLGRSLASYQPAAFAAAAVPAFTRTAPSRRRVWDEPPPDPVAR